MNQVKIGELIKKLRKEHNLTQNDFAKKYNVTYQAVSKWENGKNLPDLSLIKQICNDYNIDINELLDGKHTKVGKHKYFILLGVFLLILLTVILFINNNNFNFKTFSSGCDNFTLSGSISYNNKKSSIYISNVNYCGNKNYSEYKMIECGLYEKNNLLEKLISTSNYNGNKLVTLDSFLQDLNFTIDNYDTTCKEYSDDSFFIRIKATNDENEITIYEIPLNLVGC